MKDNPDILCDKCKEFDYIINGKKDEIFDLYVVGDHECDHEPDNKEKNDKEIER